MKKLQELPNTPICAKGRALARGVLVFAALLSLAGCATGGGGSWADFAQGFSQAQQAQSPQQPVWGGSVRGQTQTCHTQSIGGGYTQVRCQ